MIPPDVVKIKETSVEIRGMEVRVQIQVRKVNEMIFLSYSLCFHCHVEISDDTSAGDVLGSKDSYGSLSKAEL